MRGKIKSARRKASKLHGANATFLSLVDAGANETPFTIIKSANGASAMPIAKRGKTTTKKSHKTVSSSKKKAAPETTVQTIIAKMVFDSEIFKTKKSVQAYIDGAEWEAETVNITKNDDGDWEARANDLTDDDFTKIAKVNLDDEDGVEGIDAYVGQHEVVVNAADDESDDDDTIEGDGDEEEEIQKSDDASAEEDDAEEDEDEDEAQTAAEDNADKLGEAIFKGKKEPAKKAAPKSKLSKRQEFLAKRNAERAKEQKFDVWDARFSKGNTLAKALKDGMEYDGTPPGYNEVSVAFSAAVGNILSDDGLGETKQASLNTVAMQYAEIIGGLDTFFDAYVEADEETVSKSYEDADVREYLEKWAGEYADAIAADANETVVEKSTEKKSVQSIAATGMDADNVINLVKEALAPVMKQVGDIGETVEALSTRAPTKKAADASDGEPAAPRAVKKQNASEASKQATKDFMQKASERAMFG